MSDFPPDIQQRIARDERLRLIHRAIDVENELRESRVLKVILRVIEEDANEALESLINATPPTMEGVYELRARIRHWRLAKRALQSILEAGKQAEASIREEEAPQEYWSE